MGAGGWAIIVTLILIAIFFLVMNVLFFVGLIFSGRQVRFAKLAGILGTVLITVSALLSLYIFSNPFMIVMMFLSGTLSIILRVMQILIYALSWSVLLFETLALFDASRKFEGEGY